MQFLAVFVHLFLLLSLTFAKGDGNNKAKNGTSSVTRQCRQMAKLTILENFGKNETKLQELQTKGKLNQTEVDNIKAKAANATAQLAEMQKNSTLISECAIVQAGDKLKLQCKAMKGFQKAVDFSKNETALNEFATQHKLNATQLDKIKAKAANASAILEKMQSNTTLVESCATLSKAKTNGTATNEAASASSSAAAATNAAALRVASSPLVTISALTAVGLWFFSL